jgi:hypothetical protein
VLIARTGASLTSGSTALRPTTLWGETEVKIDGRNLEGLSVQLKPGARLNGSIMIDRSLGAAGASLATVRVSLMPMRDGGTALTGLPSANVTAAGQFEFPSLLSGLYALTLSLQSGDHVASRWAIKSVMVGGRDLTDIPLDLRHGEDISGVIITLTDRETEVSGALLDSVGRPTSEFTVIAITTNRRFWTPGSRRIRAVRPATNGAFRILGLPAGEYFLVAVSDVEPESLEDPTYLGLLQAASAFRFQLAEGERKKQDLRIR